MSCFDPLTPTVATSEAGFTRLPFPFQCYEVPGLKILTYNGPIYYGNRNFFREEMSRLLGLTPEKIRSREKARKALERRERDVTVSTVVGHPRLLNELNRDVPSRANVFLFLPRTSVSGQRHCKHLVFLRERVLQIR